MAIFEKGTVLETESGTKVIIKDYIASGRQGHIYSVQYGNEIKALKWYKTNIPNLHTSFRDNIARNLNIGSPSPAFLWPMAFTREKNDSFGIIMDLKSKDYIELTQIVNSNLYNFKSFRAATDCCMKIADAFRMLHNKGLCYHDINTGSFLIDPDTGNIAICDNDNISPDRSSAGVFGTSRFMAPELIVGSGIVYPDTKSDLHSLATLIFMILFSGHPLEGKNWIDQIAFSEDCIAEIYGNNPVFVFDPKDKSNVPSKIIHKHVIERWELIPEYLKDIFIRSFSKEALFNPSERTLESEWIEVLARFRCDIATCSCGNEVFVKTPETTVCDNPHCGKPIAINMSIVLPDSVTVPVFVGSTIFNVQLDPVNADDALSPVLHIIANEDNPEDTGAINMTDSVITVTTDKNRRKPVYPGDSFPLRANYTVEVGNKILKVR